jgi:hypothetical protein
MRNPPVKGWFVVNALGHCIFCGLKRVRLLEVSKVLPGCGTILPLAAYLPTNGTAFHVGPLSGQTTFWSEGLIAVSSCLWLMIKSRRTYWFPSGSHCAYIASAIKFAFSTVSSPLPNVNVYSRVSRMGLVLASPTGLPPLSLFREVMLLFTRTPPHGTEISALR